MIRINARVLLFPLILILVFGAIQLKAQNGGFVSSKDGKFYLDKKVYRFIGINFWYGAYLGMKDFPGDRKRLDRELDFLASNAISNLRVLVSSEGDSTYPFRVHPSFQKSPGEYNEEVLIGLDYLLQQCGKRNLKVVLYFTNNWEWSGGFGQYLEWNGYGKPPLPKTENWDWEKYRDYIAQYYSCEPCVSQDKELITKVVGRKNSITGIWYKEEPAIFAWELANEPRPMRSSSNEGFQNWVISTSDHVKKLDPNHLLTTGCEGDVAFEGDLNFYKKVHANPTIDYLTIHIWPKNWKWFPDTSISANMANIVTRSQKYLDRHLTLAKELNKPLVIEEYGLPRDGHQFTEGSPVSSRNRYFDWGLKLLEETKTSKSPLSGVCFWAFGGLTWFPPNGEFWKKGQPFRGDPPQEEQGLYGIYPSDSTTWKLINRYKFR